MAEKLALLQWSRVLLAGLVCGFLTYYFNGSDPDEFENKRNAAKAELDSAVKLLESTKKAESNARKFEAEAAAMDRQFHDLVRFLPAELNVSELVRTLDQEARKSGVEVKRLEPRAKSAEQVKFYERSKIDVQLRGAYSQLVLFLSYLTRVPRLLTFEKVEFAVDPADASKINFTATVVAYRYVGSPKEGEKKDGT